jgi:hypothetical protein
MQGRTSESRRIFLRGSKQLLVPRSYGDISAELDGEAVISEDVLASAAGNCDEDNVLSVAPGWLPQGEVWGKMIIVSVLADLFK